MNFTCGGGSSRVFKRALKECDESMCTSSMMKILKRLLSGRCATVSIRSRILSTCVCEAPSISRTSKAVPSPISLQFEQALQGSGVRPRSQLRALASSRAVVVLPTPRGPLKRKACATRPAAQEDIRYRCFLPDLTGFATPSCAGPSRHRPTPAGRASQYPRSMKGARQDGGRARERSSWPTGSWGQRSARQRASSGRAPRNVGRAEREGFEPSVPGRYTRSPGVPLRPLGHLSGAPSVANGDERCKRDGARLRAVECAWGAECGSPSGRHGRHTTLTTSAGPPSAVAAATRRRRPSLRLACAGRGRPRGEPPRRHHERQRSAGGDRGGGDEGASVLPAPLQGPPA